MIIKKLSAMPYAQAHVEINENTGDIYLFSYTTCVAAIINNGWLTVNGLYSMTTRRHLGAFAKEYIAYPNGEHGTYQELKHLYENNVWMNIHTGEIIEKNK